MVDVVAEFTLEPDVTYIADIEVQTVIKKHDQLENRDLPDQHPISAITGLTEALATGVASVEAEAQARQNADNALQTAIGNEITRATGAENQLSSDITSERQRALQAESVLDTKIEDETARAEGAESSLNLAITAEETARENADESLQDKIDEEELRATTAEESLGESISNEITRATIAEQANATAISNHIADKSNPHEVTKAQVGLGNVDNTSDLDKPISTATQSALNLKVNTADLGNAELDIQKNGTSVGKFTANASVDKVINLVIPTQASDVNALPDSTKYGASLSLSINSSTYVVTAQLKDQDGNNLGSAQTIDLPLESVVVNGSYDSVNKKIVLTLENGNTIDIPVGDLVAGLQSEITVDNKLASDLVDDTNQTHKFATSAQLSQIATNTSDISSLQSGKADKSTTYTKTEVDTIASGKQDNLTTAQLNAVNSGITSAKVTQYDEYSTSKANVGLDNLNANGQMIIDSQNGTISNCILEIPQNIKLTLENNTLYIEIGSILIKEGSNYVTFTTTQRGSRVINGQADGKYYIFTTPSGDYIYQFGNNTNINNIESGSSLPQDGFNGQFFYNVADRRFYTYTVAEHRWNYTTTQGNFTYPLGIIEINNGVASFAKDSNGNDMIFNGACFVGHHAVVYPNVKGLAPNQKNADGTLKSYLFNHQSLEIVEITRSIRVIGNNVNSVSGWSWYSETDDINNATFRPGERIYDSSTNTMYALNKDTIRAIMPIIFCEYNGTTVTDFTIRQPVRLATTEMLDKVQDQVDTKQDTLVSGTNIKTINSTSVLGSGNFTLADQSLSNLDSTGQMVVDSQNGTISNCILEIPQNLKLTLENNVLTLKAGSIITRSGSSYSTFTETEDKILNINYNIPGTFFVLYYGGGWFRTCPVNLSCSGTTDTLSSEATHIWFDTDTKEVKSFQIGSSGYSVFPYPLCIIDVVNGVTSFAKDSNGNDMIFNGAGFIGHHAFVYPNVKALSGIGISTNGKYNSKINTTNILSIIELSTSTPAAGYEKVLYFGSYGTAYSSYAYREVETIEERNTDTTNFRVQYVKENNTTYAHTNNGYETRELTKLVTYSSTGTTVTDFTIRQPYEGARNLLTDDIEEEVATKQVDVTTLTGYDSTATQTLKNINGVLTWVTD